MDDAKQTPDPRPVFPVRLVQAITGPWTRENLIGWVLLIAAIFFIKGCVIDQYTIPSGSMEPTLEGVGRFFHDDRVVVNKWVYGPRIPFTTVRLWNWAEPKRWDIVVFRPKKGTSEHHTLIKRIVALPGERVRIKQGKIWINGEPLDLPEDMPQDLYYVSDEDLLNQIVKAPSFELREMMMRQRAAYPYRYGSLDDDEYSLVPEDHYFLLGDYSWNSMDARVWGWVPRNHLLGRTFAIWWPWRRRRDFSGFSQTWWGMLLLYGIPALLVLFELFQWRRDVRKRREAT
jgi:signal peptidase I